MAIYQDTGTDGVKVSNAGGIAVEAVLPIQGVEASDSPNIRLFNEVPDQGVKAGDDATAAFNIGVIDRSGTDGNEVSDTAGIAIESTLLPDIVKTVDSAVSQLAQSGGGSEVVTDSVKGGDAGGIAIESSLAIQGVKVVDSASGVIGTGGVAVTGIDGARVVDGVTISRRFDFDDDTARASDAAGILIESPLDTQGVKVTDDAVGELSTGIINKFGTDGVVASDAITIDRIIPFRDDDVLVTDEATAALRARIGVDGVEASDQPILRLSRIVPSQGVKAGDFATVGKKAVQSTDGVRASDTAFAQAIVGSQVEGVKAGDSESIRLAAPIPSQGTKAGDNATVVVVTVPTAAAGDDGVKVSDTVIVVTIRPTQTGSDGVKTKDRAKAKRIKGFVCHNPHVADYSCQTDGQTAVVDLVEPLTTEFDCGDEDDAS